MTHNNQSQIANAIILGAFIIAGAILIKDSAPTNVALNPDNIAPTEMGPIRPIGKDDHIVGSPNARLVIVEYSDTECPYCKEYHKTLAEVTKTKGNGEVAWVYRHFPIPQLHPKAPKQAEATECAWEQGGNTAFWNYINKVFEVTPSNNGLPDAELLNIARNMGLNTAQFKNCLDSGKYKAKVDADIAEARGLQVTGTPMSFILSGGEIVGVIPGNQPIDKIYQVLDQLK
jgi:protein-disulfide isomerase